MASWPEPLPQTRVRRIDCWFYRSLDKGRLMKYPRTRTDKFHAKGDPDPERYGEGFVMTVPVAGNHFRVGIQLPKTGAHGLAYIIFYASFWEANGTHSIIETGISFSADPAKKLNFTAVGTVTADSHHKPVQDDHFKLANDVSGQYFIMDVTFGSDKIVSKLGNHTLIRTYKSQKIANEKVGKVHLVIATADNRDAYYSKASINMLKVDDSTNFPTGYVEWQGSKFVNVTNRRSVILDSHGTGMTCSLPQAERLESGPADAQRAQMKLTA